MNHERRETFDTNDQNANDCQILFDSFRQDQSQNKQNDLIANLLQSSFNNDFNKPKIVSED